MSSFLVSVVIHGLVVSFVWVGLSVSSGRQQNSFTYLGELIPGTRKAVQKVNSNQAARSAHFEMFEESTPAQSTQWLKMRELNKPR